MELNYPLLIGVGVAGVLLIAFMIYRNFKDEQDFEKNIDARDEHTTHHDKTRDEKRV